MTFQHILNFVWFVDAALFTCIWTLYYSVALQPLSSAISCLIKLAPLPPFLSIEFSCLSFKVVYCDKRQENTAQTPSIHHFWDVSVLSCRRSRRGVTPIWGRPEHRSKTSRRTLGMGWNSCSCLRSSQVKILSKTVSRAGLKRGVLTCRIVKPGFTSEARGENAQVGFAKLSVRLRTAFRY